MAQVKGIFLNVQNKAAFLERLNAGDIKNTLIAFIKDTHEIWTQGVYYSVGSLTEEDVIRIIGENGGGFTKDNFIEYLKSTNTTDFPLSVQNSLSKADSALQEENVYSWALSNNNDLIPEEKLSVLVSGYLYENRFYSTKVSEDSYETEIPAKAGKFYYDQNKGKLYIYQNNRFTPISGSSSSEGGSDLSAYLTAADAEQIYATKESLTQSINDLINGAPEALDTLKEISDALEGNNNLINDILDTLSNVYTKAQADDKFLTKVDASNTYVTKTLFSDYLSTINNELTLIKERLSALEAAWSNIPEDEYSYYMGTTEVNAGNYLSLMNYKTLPSTYTSGNNGSDFEVLYFAVPSNENLNVTSTALQGAEISKELIATVDNYNLYRVPASRQFSGTININVN